MEQPATTPEPPYFAVVFSAVRTAEDAAGYAEMADPMVTLAAHMSGFLGIESVRGDDGFGITVSYWSTEAAIRNWQQNAEHLEAQHLGRERWYERFQLRVCRVERAYGFHKHS
jgi:heme-degrading monooxygenase HmoA